MFVNLNSVKRLTKSKHVNFEFSSKKNSKLNFIILITLTKG